MKLATLCSGIGAPEVAAKRLGWECLWSAEIDPQASAVLAFHHPESVNLGDITKIDGRELERPDVLVFGTPCQSFSVAGRRAGMDDPRGVLAFVALGIVDRVRPTWFILENVPGMLSSNAGRDFGAFLWAVDGIGYSGAWASPDAQFFGVAQRREHVFFVGHIGDWRYPAAVLSQFSRLCGHPAPDRTATPQDWFFGNNRSINCIDASYGSKWANNQWYARGHIIWRTAGLSRLTPTEVERCFGYPDNYTLIPYKGKPMADGSRYKMLGNSISVPVLEWLLRNIEQISALAEKEEGC